MVMRDNQINIAGKEENSMMLDITKIDTILAEQGMTKSYLAQKSGISRQNLSTILTRSSCEPKTAGKLAKGLGVKIADITRQ